jgi:Regulator of chromosome condensation (RCC1) repeat
MHNIDQNTTTTLSNSFLHQQNKEHPPGAILSPRQSNRYIARDIQELLLLESHWSLLACFLEKNFRVSSRLRNIHLSEPTSFFFLLLDMSLSNFSPRSLTGVGTSESASASGCAMSERDRPTALRRTNNTHASHSELDGLAVFTWGRGEDGQLGLGDTSDQDEPTYVDSLRGVGVRQIACGSGHTVVLSTEGEVYTWGRGDDGRLGHGDNGWKYVPRITQALAGQVVVQVTCGSYHTAAVTGNGDLYTW